MFQSVNSFGVCIICAINQLVATYNPVLRSYRMIWVALCPIFVLIFEYGHQYEHKAWEHDSKFNRCGQIALSVLFASWTQMICYHSAISDWLRIPMVALPLATTTWAHFRQRRIEAVGPVDAIVDELKIPVEA